MRRFLITLFCASNLSLPVLAMAQEPAVEALIEEESLPMAPQALDGFNGVPQSAFAPRDGEVLVRKPASAFVGPAKPQPRKAVKTPRKALKNLNVSR